MFLSQGKDIFSFIETGNLTAVVRRNNPSIPNLFSVTVLGDKLYLSNKNVLSVNKRDGSNLSVLRKGQNSRNVQAYYASRQPPGGACQGNGGCQELCLAVSESLRR